MMQQLAVGVDVGGTKIGFALINQQGELLAAHRVPTEASEGPDAVAKRIAEGVLAVLKGAKHPMAGIGIGYPGYVDPKTGIAKHSCHLGWSEIPLREVVSQHLDHAFPIWISIDANASALGEMYFGAARDCQDFVYLTIGTGLGGGAIIGGKLFLGANFYSMEVGHFSLDPAGRECTCGLRGCPDAYVSGGGLLAGVLERLPDYPHSVLAKINEPSTAQILQAARDGDELALGAMAEAREWLCKVVVCCTGLFNPAMIVIGGGLGHAAADFFIHGLRKCITERTLPMSHEGLEIVESQVEDSAIGAACLVWHGLSADAHE